MKKIFVCIVLAVMAVPFLAGCGEQSQTVDSAPKTVEIDSSGVGKKGAMENDKGLKN